MAIIFIIENIQLTRVHIYYVCELDLATGKQHRDKQRDKTGKSKGDGVLTTHDSNFKVLNIYFSLHKPRQQNPFSISRISHQRKEMLLTMFWMGTITFNGMPGPCSIGMIQLMIMIFDIVHFLSLNKNFVRALENDGDDEDCNEEIQQEKEK